jgi:hypothetical protein
LPPALEFELRRGAGLRVSAPRAGVAFVTWLAA